MTRTVLLPVLLAPLALASCSKPVEPDVSSTPPPVTQQGTAGKAHGKAHGAPPGAAGAGQGEVAWDAPPAWQKAENASPMRKATYTVPRAAGDAEDGELSVTQAGGSVEQNVKRWAGQLDAKPDDVKRFERRAAGFKVTVVEIHGSYTPMAMPGTEAKGPKPGFALLGAIVETSPPTFFKLVGPEKTVVASRPAFDALIDSLRAK